jgi:tRNA(adenine34) deaminase
MHNTKKNLFYIKKLYSFIKQNSLKEIPIAALIIENNVILDIKKNNYEENTLLNHAECIVINTILKQYNKKNLINCILFVTLEPCIICVGVAIRNKIKIIYYLCKSIESGIQTKYNILCLEEISIIPILIYEEKINILLKLFFKQLRNNNSNNKIN